MDDYINQLRKYQQTLAIASGCGGERTQCYIDTSYDRLKSAHDKLTDKEKQDNPLPTKASPTDDGTGV